MPSEFVDKVLSAAESFPWITRTEENTVGKVAKVRLWLNGAFVDVYHNSETGSTSYAYIESGTRLFGANNMKIGWHIHPFGDDTTHEPSDPISIEAFLAMLEQRLRDTGKIT